MRQTSWQTLVWVVVFAGPGLADDKANSERLLTFEQDVRPIFKAYCLHCHGEGEKLAGGLDLRLRRLIVQGGKSGPALLPGKRDESLLFEKISKGEMPKEAKKLSSEELARVGQWIASGAKTAKEEPAEIASGFRITQEDRQFWAFQPIRRPAIPKVEHADRVRTPIDAFLLARLEEKDLSFSPDSDKRMLIRRATFDLIGLPPTPHELARFLADDSPDAYERLIDRLLASSHYGERWGRHWLDVAGYADSEGYSNDDTERKYAYKYRDYVIRSLNADKPFDWFLQEQLAGDEMVRPPYKNLSPDDIEKLTATGFLRMAPDGTASGGVDQALASNQVMADMIQIVSSSLCGLTVACAQCHNHRYDPIPQTDYYRLRAIFEPAYDWKNWRTPPARLISLYTDADVEKAKQIEAEAVKIDQERLNKEQEYIEQTFAKELAKIPEELREPIRVARNTPDGKRTAEQTKLLKDHPSVNVTAGSLYLYDPKAAEDLKQYAAKAGEMRATKPVEEFVSALTEVPGQVPATYLFARGRHDQPKQALEPGELTVLASLKPTELPVKDASLPSSGRRLAYARRLTDGTHPLTARVSVNRIWMYHFGRGIVATPADFGTLGERPTHPELLDWLASEFMAPSNPPLANGGTQGGWSLKRLHKLIVTSTAYRQASRREAKQDAIDPDNCLYGRMSIRRLEAEAVRDSILATSGKLNVKQFGPPIPVKPDLVGQIVVGVDTTDGAGRPTGKEVPLHGEEFRRSLYIQVRRSKPLAVLGTFDWPAMEPNCAARTVSTVSPQALMFMNSEFVVEQARYFAERVRQEAGSETRAQLAHAWRLAFADEPTNEEIEQALALFTAQAEHFRPNAPVAAQAAQENKPPDTPDPQLQALASFCQALMSASGFLYVD